MTGPDNRARDCASPIEAAELMDYWLALLPPAAEEAIEEHLLACDGCGDRLRAAIELAEGLRTLARSGSLRVIVSERFVQQAADEGRRVRAYELPSGGAVQCTVAADDDFLVARLAADLTGASRVDLICCDTDGVEWHRLSDIPVRTDAGAIVYQESITFAKASPSTTMIARLMAIGPEGAERLLGQYTFHHTRTISDPPAS